MNAGLFGAWVANLVAVTLPAVMLGKSGVTMPGYLCCMAVSGVGMMLVEQPAHARALLHRTDVRAYAVVRAALSALAGAVPYSLGALAASR